MCSRTSTTGSTGPCWDNVKRLVSALRNADAVVIGAGAGLSTAAGFTYSGPRFERYFSDFGKVYGFRDMYSGGFYPYDTPEELWAYWSRYIWINRYMDPPKPVYEELLRLVDGMDYFALTTNVDHCFQKAGFDKKRLFYTQGDYGLWQCSEPCHNGTYDNERTVREMVLAQGFALEPGGVLTLPADGALKQMVPSELVPRCPRCGRPMVMNLRSDDKFVEDDGWHDAAERYASFLRTRTGKVLFLELGVGYNTPGIIKYPFWSRTAGNPAAVYACINTGQAVCPAEIRDRAICIDGEIGTVLRDLEEAKNV